MFSNLAILLIYGNPDLKFINTFGTLTEACSWANFALSFRTVPAVASSVSISAPSPEQEPFCKNTMGMSLWAMKDLENLRLARNQHEEMAGMIEYDIYISHRIILNSNFIKSIFP